MSVKCSYKHYNESMFYWSLSVKTINNDINEVTSTITITITVTVIVTVTVVISVFVSVVGSHNHQ